MVAVLIGAGLVVIGTVVLVTHRQGGHRVMLGCAMRRLKATDEQKQRLSALYDEARARLGGPTERVRALRREVVGLWAAPELDIRRLEALESQLFEAVGEGSQVVRDLVARTHEILDAKQRQKVAEWLRRHHHHRCHGAACHC